MKKIVFLLSLLIGFNNAFGQDWITDSNFDDKIHEKSAFGDDEMSIVIVEFWAKFNDANSFQDWDKIKGITHYYRIDISKAPNAKKEYRIRMAPTIIVFKDGINTYTVSGDGNAPKPEIRYRAVVNGLLKYGGFEKIDNFSFKLKCNSRNDKVVNLLLPLARNISATEESLAADDMAGQMTTQSLGFAAN